MTTTALIWLCFYDVKSLKAIEICQGPFAEKAHRESVHIVQKCSVRKHGILLRWAEKPHCDHKVAFLSE